MNDQVFAPQQPFDGPTATDISRTADKPTPVMAQYIEIKAANPDCLLFYRMGDFYELFFDDAEIASRTLGIVLTKRGKHMGQDIPMCGVPIHRADEYLQRLIAAGHRVAVCEQMEDPAEARKRGSKSVVRRDVTRLITPGTITEDALLDPSKANVLAAVARQREGAGWSFGVALADISTGTFLIAEADEASLGAAIARFDPSEVLVPDAIRQVAEFDGLWRDWAKRISPLARDGMEPQSAEQKLTQTFGVGTLEGFGTFSAAEIAAAGALVAYLDKTQLGNRVPLQPPRREAIAATMQIDAATRANLELTRTLAGERTGSLLHAIDRTCTPFGGRLLVERLASPSTDLRKLGQRHDAVSYLLAQDDLRRHIRHLLRQTPDLLRALTRITMDRGGPRDLAAIRDGARNARALADILPADAPDDILSARTALRTVPETLPARLTDMLADELPLLKRDGGFVREGYSPGLDQVRRLKDDSRSVIAGLQADYVGVTDCRTLRIKFNNMLGYYIEVPPPVGERMVQPPLNATFFHRQTMAGAMRFSTTELGELESKIVSAGERAVELELRMFADFASEIVSYTDQLRAATNAMAEIDVAAGLAELAEDLNWVRPELTERPDFHIEQGRHPVVEAAVRARGSSFIANGCELGAVGDAGRILLVTGPNMAGKSTYLRQNALIAILAQMGSFVPASVARIGIVDKLFSRVGAADDLARGRSTFMVEMVETAAILNQATSRSLVILDEIGRGTATYDGLSIAWATVEHLHNATKARALFATHFHELTALARKLNRLHPVTMKVTEYKGNVVFLHEVAPGAADKSYGIQVAKLAGLPRSVVDRARMLLKELEQQERMMPARMVDELPLFATGEPAAVEVDRLREAIEAINPDDMSPRDALEALYRLKRISLD